MARLILPAMSLKWLMITVANLCSHSLTAVSHLATNVGLPLSTIMGLMVILSLAGVLPLEIALDSASWWFVGPIKGVY